MRRAHDITPLVKVANLARWFPPLTVTREQWSKMMRPAVSGIAVDTQSHWNAVVSPVSGHRSSGYAWGFPRCVYAADAYFSGGIGCGVVTKASSSMHRRCAREIAAWMSLTSLRDTSDRTPEVSSRPNTSRRSGSRSGCLTSRRP